ncbi:2-dehydropantoate 2-reductase [Nocardioides daedukensis]|uniref:2-dehydropantoate 2-reductase n=1 Tax=Nocardioides daedukensis TaxID=634462 RepID=A0A7Y9S3G0_9ACTN|nr:2-dehydropantoate 2-reductase [Nocardioides daedukensis]NYG59852.1 2-dehydropantoate 2-reductase [Nocardioides daedukensis]
MRVLVVGAGAIGGLIAAEFALAGGHEVSLAVRRPVPGLVLEEAGVERVAPVTLVQDPALVAPADVVVVATKAYDVDGIGPWLVNALTDSTDVVVAQNGIEHAERMAGHVSADRVIPAIVKHAVERRAAGHIERTSHGDIKVPDTAGGRRFAEAGRGTTLGITVVEDFETALWIKLAYNLSGNSVSTITDLRVRELGVRAPLQELIRHLVAECTEIAAGRGVALPPDLATTIVDEFAAYPDSIHSSMWQDLRAGRPFEHDAISGAVVRAAAAQGKQAPFSEMATLLLGAISPVRHG